MGANVLEFEQALDRWEHNELPALWTAFVRKLTLDIHRRVVIRTPRLTGRAQNSWVVSVGTASDFVPPEGAASYPIASPADALAALSELRPGDDVYISSNVIYISYLNDGSSQQAPAHFVEMAIMEATAGLEAAA